MMNAVFSLAFNFFSCFTKTTVSAIKQIITIVQIVTGRASALGAFSSTVMIGKNILLSS